MRIGGFLPFSIALVVSIIGSACQTHIVRPSPDISFEGIRLLYRGKRFSGIVETRFDGVGVTRKTSYRSGLRDGLEEEIYDSGAIAARREYRNDDKVGAHEAWYPDGHRRSHYEYTANQFSGEVWEWYDSGAVAIYARFEQGQCLGKKYWREDGTIYLNYVFPRGRPVGLPGAKLCYQVRKDPLT